MRSPRARLRWQDPKVASRRRNWLGYEVIIFSELGLYPEGTHLVPDGLFHADEQIAFGVVRGSSWDRLDPDLPLTELRGLSPDQLRLVAALMLCEVRNGARLMFYPATEYAFRLDARRLRLDSQATIAEIRALVLERCAEEAAKEERFRRFKSPVGTYQLWNRSEFALERLPEFFEALNPVDYVVYRGMHALMKADMLSRYREFWEEATTACYVALDASFSVVQERLREEGVAQPSSVLAQRWVHQHFNAAFGLPEPGPTDKYFGEMYEQRIMTLHPKSRLGESPVAPLMYEDYMFMRRDLREMFAYLLTGRHGDDYQRDLDVHLGVRRPSA
ncbi:hypothetical protein EKH80_02795 [Dyella choica]|uniref:Uncharacterized protein n=1 Tax=Dyella choica TaxID=1927959 RepID=A0A432M993_9GAMM|nr:hypothetical protein EKH80_02795 [Dyella choica]